MSQGYSSIFPGGTGAGSVQANNFLNPQMQGPLRSGAMAAGVWENRGGFDTDARSTRGGVRGAAASARTGVRGRMADARGGIAAFSASMDKGYVGRTLKRSALESAGFHYEGGSNRGFLGSKDWAMRGPDSASQHAGYQKQYARARGHGAGRINAAQIASRRTGVEGVMSRYGNARTGHGGNFTPGSSIGPTRRMGRVSSARAAFRGAGGSGGGLLKGAGGVAMKSFGLLATAGLMHEGYQEEGVWGAAKGAGESVAWTAGFNVVAGAVGSIPLAVAVTAAGAGYGVYAAGEGGRAHLAQVQNLEMGGTNMQGAIQSHGGQTMRQRSLQSLSNSHINGRMALGNEAFLVHTPFR